MLFGTSLCDSRVFHASSLGLSVYGIVPGFQGQLIWVAGSGSLNVVKFRLVAI